MANQWTCNVCGIVCSAKLGSCNNCHYIRGATPESAKKGMVGDSRPSGCLIATLILIPVLVYLGFIVLQVFTAASWAK
jgi:hypothetical protein